MGATPPRNGIFVLPDNHRRGTLEDLLLECAAVEYPRLQGLASSMVAGATKLQLSARDRRDLDAPAGPRKATVAGIGSVLRPGKAVQVTIDDNDWLSPRTLALPRIAAVDDFLSLLFDLKR